MVPAGLTKFDPRTTNRSRVSILASDTAVVLIAFGRRTLPIFLTDPVPDTLVAKNRRVALDFLRGLSDRRDIALQETCILTWGQIVRSVFCPVDLPTH